MATRITCKGELGFTGPEVLIDPLEVNGSVLLIEPGHGVYPMKTGSLENGDLIPNVLGKRSNSLGIELSGSYFYNAGLSGLSGTVERTQKGAIHGIVSQSNLSQDEGAEIRLPADVIKYLIDNPNNEIYISAWMKLTRDGVANQPARVLIGIAESNNMLTYFYRTGIRPSSGKILAAYNQNISQYLDQPVVQAIAVNGWTEDEVPSNPGDIYHHIKWGALPGINNSASYLDSMPSYVFYRFYIEDLTVSGRTHAEVNGLDNIEFNKAFGVDGRYYADSYTDPDTIV